MSEPPPYEITCTGGTDAGGTWIIQAKIEYSGDPPPEGSELEARARVELLLSIAEVGLRGRELGHDQARLFMDEGRGSVTEILPGHSITHHRKQ